MAEETGELSDNVFDLRVVRWLRDPIVREVLEGMDKMNDDERLVYADHIGYIKWLREGNGKLSIEEYAAEIRMKRQRWQD